MTETSVLAIITTVLAGLAHLVERHLAKVEVASSSLVARSKKETPPIGWCFFFGAGKFASQTYPAEGIKKQGKQAMRRQWRKKRACFEEAALFVVFKRPQTAMP